MSEQTQITEQELAKSYLQMEKDAEANGYNLNPDADFTRELVKGLLINQRRYGYGNCPCRLASGDGEADLDMVCPCDYRDADLSEFGTCF
jgi:ferredoxin-thioredoxin reductase catalytic chain